MATHKRSAVATTNNSDSEEDNVIKLLARDATLSSQDSFDSTGFCAVCRDDEAYEDNQLVQCAKCEIGVMTLSMTR